MVSVNNEKLNWKQYFLTTDVRFKGLRLVLRHSVNETKIPKNLVSSRHRESSGQALMEHECKKSNIFM